MLQPTKHPIMAATLEELLSLVEPAPPCPSVFLDNPSVIHADSQQPQHDLTLEYISCMLLEEYMADMFLYQYPDNSRLLEAEQPFAQIHLIQ